jgi:hypothetical protein
MNKISIILDRFVSFFGKATSVLFEYFVALNHQFKKNLSAIFLGFKADKVGHFFYVMMSNRDYLISNKNLSPIFLTDFLTED